MFGIKTARAQAANAQELAALARVDAHKTGEELRSEVTDLSWQLFKLSRHVNTLGWQLCALAAVGCLLALRIRESE